MPKQQKQFGDIEANLPFPIEGVDKQASYFNQRPGTCVDALNVMAFEPETGRARGGRRMGTRRYFSDVAVGAQFDTTKGSSIQDLAILKTNVLTTTVVNYQGAFSYALTSGSGFGVGDSTGAGVSVDGIASGFAFSNSCWDSSGNLYVGMFNSGTGVVTIYSKVAGSATGTTRWSSSVITGATARGVAGMVVAGTRLFVCTIHTAAPTVRIYAFDSATGGGPTTWQTNETVIGFSVMVPSTNAVNCLGAIGDLIGMDCADSTNAGFLVMHTLPSQAGNTKFVNGQGHGFRWYGLTAGLANSIYGVATTTTQARSRVVSDGTSRFYVIASVSSGDGQVLAVTTSLGLVWKSTAAGSAQGLAYNATPTPMLVAACNSNPSARQLSLTTGLLVGSGANPGSATTWHNVDSDNRGSFTFWRNAQASNDVMGTNSSFATLWGPSSFANTTHDGASVNKALVQIAEQTGSIRKLVPLVVSAGEVRTFSKDGTTAITSGNALSISNLQTFSAQANLFQYYADGNGYKYYDPTTGILGTWAATSGSLPTDSAGRTARLIESWNQRLVMAGVPGNPNYFYATARGNPNDLLYTEVPDTTTSPFTGALDDIINAMVPHQEDFVFGCDRSIYLMRGDLKSGGVILPVSYSLGMVWGRPWCIDPNMQIFFYGSDGCIYKMTPGAQPTEVGQAIRHDLQSIDLTANKILMAWDLFTQSLLVFVSPADPAAQTVHYCWQQATNAWFPFQFAKAAHNPMSILMFDKDDPQDRRVMLGGRDGRVRIFDISAEDDDGTPITSSVTIGPLKSPQLDELMFMGMQPTFSEATAEVDYAIYSGRTPESALAAGPRLTGTFGTGRNRLRPVMRAGHIHYVKLTSTADWAMERFMTWYRLLPAIRRRA